MSVKQSVKQIPHSWLGLLFKRQHNAIALDAEGMTFINPNGAANGGEQTRFTWLQLDQPPVFLWSWFGFLLSFTAAGKAYQIPFLSYFAKSRFRDELLFLWANKNQPRLSELVARVERVLIQEYLRQSRLEMIGARVAREYHRWFPWCEKVSLSREAQTALHKLQLMHRWSDADVSRIREDYIQSQLAQYAEFFERVESNPLTDKQRRACVIDDNNNLLLAGAGTGKTSVMVGRAGYLVESGQARAGDILLLAYGKKAAEEMDQRIKLKLGTDAIKASTFHSLGLKIIAEVEGTRPSLSPWVSDEKAKDKWVHDSLEMLIGEEDYLKQVFDYFSHYYYVEKNPFEFETQGGYFEYLNDNDVRSLKGERLKSFGELTIANWLFRNGIEYQYEAKYEQKVSSITHRQYLPDFYLPEYGVYIEYYGVDEQGNTAPYIDRDAYHESMQWKRNLHDEHQTACVELFYFQHQQGRLTIELEKSLQTFAVQCCPLPGDAILETLRELGRVTELAKLFSQLIGLYKAACLDEAGLEQVFDNAVDSKQTRKVFELLEPILQRYQQHLAARDEIDFEDMIAKALAYLQQGEFISPWRYIMVDEFQDISEPRARLVRALRDSCEPDTKSKASLFCVGDDWQAIYRFSGADVGLTTRFKAYFGATAETRLDFTFRFNNSIGEVATQFVSQNPAQLKKEIHSLSQVTQPAVSVVRRGVNQGATNDEPSTNALEQALNAIAGRAKQNASVYLLARFWFRLPDKAAVRQLNAQYPGLTIECQSFHAAKGKEADYVVIMGMDTGVHGFPSKKMTPPLLEALLPKAEEFEFAEERRLFYVALTRAKHRAYVLADMTNVSPFVVELIKDDYAVELEEFDTSMVQKLFEQSNCVRCTTGTLKPRTGKFKPFYSCCHYPLCEHKEDGCELCGSPMTRKRFSGFQVCLNDACGHTRPLCNVCGAEMAARTGKYGDFWGCKNHRRDDPTSCSNTLKKSKPALPVNS